MKKKIISIISIVVVLVMTFAATVSAATPAISAKKGAATVDGVINASEYGAKVTMNASNSVNFAAVTPAGATCPTIDFYFAWTATDLYVAFTSTDLKLVDKPQICINPGNIITDNTKPGEFWTLATAAASDQLVVTRHNYLEQAVTSTVTSKVVSTATSLTAEVKIPFSTILVNDTAKAVNFSTFAPADNAVIKIALFVMRDGSQTGKASNWTTVPHTPVFNITDLDGTLTLAAAGAVTPNPTTADLGLVSMAVMAVASMVVLKRKK